MGMSVNRGSNGYKPPTMEQTPQIETEAVEEMYAIYEEPRSTATETQSEGVNLRSIIPDSDEDMEAGFRKLRKEEFTLWQIPGDRSLYRTREDASRNIFKITAGRVGEHLTELMAFKFPPKYLWDSYGMTPECVAELLEKIEYTARTIIPLEKLPSAKRGDIKTLGIPNPKYSQRLEYWEEVAKRSAEYRAWVEQESSDSDEPAAEVYEGEWVFQEPPGEREERQSKLRSQIEIAGQAVYQEFENYFNRLKNKLVKLADDKGLEARIAVDQRFSTVALNPEKLDEDEDL